MTFPCTVFSKWRMDFRPLSFFSSSPTPEASMDPFSPASRSFQIFCAPPILSFVLLFVAPSLRFAISLIFVFIGSFSPVVFHCSSNIMARVAGSQGSPDVYIARDTTFLSLSPYLHIPWYPSSGICRRHLPPGDGLHGWQHQLVGNLWGAGDLLPVWPAALPWEQPNTRQCFCQEFAQGGIFLRTRRQLSGRVPTWHFQVVWLSFRFSLVTRTETDMGSKKVRGGGVYLEVLGTIFRTPQVSYRSVLGPSEPNDWYPAPCLYSKYEVWSKCFGGG